MCPICCKSDRNTGGLHSAWAYFDGCITRLSSAPKCIGLLLNEDPLNGQGKPLIPSATKNARDCLPCRMTILCMAPGGHRQWPMSISALLDRLSWLVLQTRPLVLSSFQAAVQKNPRWSPRHHCGPRVAVAPAPPIKFLDIGTKMGCHRIGEHIPGRDETDNIFHPRFVGEGIPAANTFHSIVYERLAKGTPDGELWCLEEAWFAHSPKHDFRVKDPQGYMGPTSASPNLPEEALCSGSKEEVC